MKSKKSGTPKHAAPTPKALRKSAGGAFESRGRFFARLTVAPQKRTAVLLPWCTCLPDAVKRATALQSLVNALRAAGQDTFITNVVEHGGELDEVALAELQRSVAGIVKGRIVADPQPGKGGAETFQTFGEKWTNGDLHAKWPDAIPLKKSSHDISFTLARLYPTIGHIPLTSFTLADAHAAMRALPREIEVGTRRNYAKLISRVLTMAAYPAGIIGHSPLPRGFVPKPGNEKAKGLPWPKEDAAGLACETWPLCDRMIFGVLPREGLRAGEAARLTWTDLALDVGAIRLDENKTDAPRAWALDPSVALALRLWKAMRTDTKPGDLVFKDRDGRSYDVNNFAAVYREYLETACHARREILEAGPNRMRVRAHDMRGMFVTYALANGKTEAWVMDRTGHTTSAMLNRYRRTARTVGELGLGALVPMAEAIPEIAAMVRADAAAKRGSTGRKRAPASASRAVFPRESSSVTGAEVPSERPLL